MEQKGIKPAKKCKKGRDCYGEKEDCERKMEGKRSERVLSMVHSRKQPYLVGENAPSFLQTFRIVSFYTFIPSNNYKLLLRFSNQLLIQVLK